MRSSPPIQFLFKSFVLLTFLLCSSTLVKAQQTEQLEILIVPTAHQNPQTPEKFRPEIEKLKQYNPDMVFGEFQSAKDLKEALVVGYWGKRNDERRLDYLRKLNTDLPKNTTKEIAKSYRTLAKNEKNHQARMNLARDLYMGLDRANADYQLFLLETQLKPSFGKEELAAYHKMFGSTDSLQKLAFIRKDSEYQKIIFPLLSELKHPQLYPMDCQKYDNEWNKVAREAYIIMQDLEKKAAADSTSPEGKTFKRVNDFLNAGWKEAYVHKSFNFAFMSTPEYTRINRAQTFCGGPTFYGAPGFPTEEVKQMIHFYILRNQGMCENVVRQAREKGAKKVMVAVGAAHHSWMEDIFKTMPNIKVVNYNDI